MKQLTLKEWIEREGVPTLAKALKVNEATVRHWRRGFTFPNSSQMHRIRALSKGAVSIDKSVDAHFSSSNKNRFRA